ncbi:MAG: hypothetical protein AAF489_13630 [Bacteroidota bacterium]
MERQAKKSEPLHSMASLHSAQLQSQESGDFQFQDNRPQTVTQRKLQQLSTKSVQANSLRAIQFMANGNRLEPVTNAENGRFIMRTSESNDVAPIQRAVITVNADHLISDSAQTVADVTGAKAGAFSEVEAGETIHIFGHGYHSLTRPLTKEEPQTNLEPELKGGITAAKLVQMMVEQGWTEEHKGAIDLRACMSGAESLLPSFAQLFATELKKIGRSNMVTGYKELTITKGDGTEKSGKPTVSKMIAVARSLNPDDHKNIIFAMEATMLFESQHGGLRERRQKADEYSKVAKHLQMLFIGEPPHGMSPLEWNVYSFYYAISTENKALIAALNGDFTARDSQINKTGNAPHARHFNPEEMVVPEEEDDHGGLDEDLLARLNAL